MSRKRPSSPDPIESRKLPPSADSITPSENALVGHAKENVRGLWLRSRTLQSLAKRTHDYLESTKEQDPNLDDWRKTLSLLDELLGAVRTSQVTQPEDCLNKAINLTTNPMLPNNEIVAVCIPFIKGVSTYLLEYQRYLADFAEQVVTVLRRTSEKTMDQVLAEVKQPTLPKGLGQPGAAKVAAEYITVLLVTARALHEMARAMTGFSVSLKHIATEKFSHNKLEKMERDGVIPAKS
ncbi:hypothetical protein LTS08_004650 [Lithohypha guttulata]|nr:hypothetical protein LTS08_004650 [Lithohypha guttulata]